MPPFWTIVEINHGDTEDTEEHRGTQRNTEKKEALSFARSAINCLGALRAASSSPSSPFPPLALCLSPRPIHQLDQRGKARRPDARRSQKRLSANDADGNQLRLAMCVSRRGSVLDSSFALICIICGQKIRLRRVHPTALPSSPIASRLPTLRVGPQCRSAAFASLGIFAITFR